MRLFETLMAVVVVFSFVLFALNISKLKQVRFMVVLSGIVMFGIHLLVEQYRWQMVPLYLVLAVFVIMAIIRFVSAESSAEKKKKGIVRLVLKIAGYAACIILLLLTIGLPLVFPVTRLPKPTGEFTVGTMELEWIDTSRNETMAVGYAGNRDLMVRLWYPSQTTQIGPKARFWPDVKRTGAALAQSFGFPGFVFEHLDLIRSNSYENVSLIQNGKQFPVILFSHGYDGLLIQNVIQMEELASHGYIVVSMAHPYEAAGISYPDHRLALMTDRNATPAEENDKISKAWQNAMDSLSNTKDEDGITKIAGELFEAEHAMQNSLHVWTDDTVFVLDKIESLNQGIIDGPDVLASFTDRIDLENVGVFGHSFGGAAAGQACLEDSRFKAGINMDGLQYGDVLGKGIKQPFLFLNGYWDEGLIKLQKNIYSRNEGPFYYYRIQTAQHYDFSNLVVVSPFFRYLGLLGQVDNMKFQKALDEYLLAFFDCYLKGEELTFPATDSHGISFEKIN